MEYAIKNQNGIYESIEFSNINAIQTQGKGVIILQNKIDDNQYCNYLNIAKQNIVTKLDMPSEVTLKLTSKYPFNYTIPNIQPRYYNKTKIEDFLYEITYGNIDYKYAYQHFNPTLGGCSAIRNGDFFGRNFDWLYNNQVQFIVHTPISLDRYGVLGVSGIIPGVEQSNVDQDDIIIDDINMFKLVPFYLLDGINSAGVFCTHNIVHLDNEESPTTEIVAKKEEKDRINAFMLPRFILDKFSTAQKAIDYLINYTTIYFSDNVISASYQSHFLLGDYDSTYVLEFINGEIHIIQTNYITNFNIYGVEFKSNGELIKPYIQSGINKYGFGLERWNIITSKKDSCNTLEGMRELLDSIKYSNCYDLNNFWYSETVCMNEDDHTTKITVDSNPENCKNARRAMIAGYHNKQRDIPKSWITCHSSIYDIKQKKLYIRNQENNIEYNFSLA